MDFGHDERFYDMMRDAVESHAREFPNCKAYLRHINNGPVSSNDRAIRFKEYQDCMQHADELERLGVKRIYFGSLHEHGFRIWHKGPSRQYRPQPCGRNGRSPTR